MNRFLPTHARSLIPALLLAVGACGSDDGTSPGNDDTPAPDTTPAAVSITPGDLGLEALGATAQLSATVQNAAGTTLSGAGVTWASADASVAAVAASGQVTAVAVGTTTVTATAGSVSGTATVTVSQVPAAVTVEPGTAEVLPGAQTTLTAAVADANGHAIADATVAWASADETVVTVAGGVVTGVNEGTTTVTASSGAASGMAAVTVLAPPPDFEPTENTTLGGTVNAGAVTIPAGVTVTVTEDLVLNTTGPVSISGTLQGDCVAVAVNAGGGLTLTGATVSNACATGVVDLTLFTAGTLTVSGSAITGGGAVIVTNDPDAPEVEVDPDGAPFRTAWAALGTAEVARTAEESDCDVSNTSIVSKDGADGAVPGGDGHSGSVAQLWCEGDARYNDLTVVAGRGGDGGDHDSRGPEPAVGGDGGFGGSASVGGRGVVQLRGRIDVRGGDAGRGGDAFHFPTEPGASADARGGEGRRGGDVSVAALGSLDYPSATELLIRLGRGGRGGDATATGVDGQPGQVGGDATAYGGRGGANFFANQEVFEESALHSIIKGMDDVAARARVVFEPLVGGRGGHAIGTSGRGGDGAFAGAPGRRGGNADVRGGRAGIFSISDNGPNPLDIRLGDGGNATYRRGGGGDGAPGEVCGPGGAGGDGGHTLGSGGGRPGAISSFSDAMGTPGTWGATLIEDFGNGGNGAEGTDGGARGAAGTNGVDPEDENDVAPVVTGSFQPGEPGGDLPCQATLNTTVTVKDDKNGHNPFLRITDLTSVVFRPNYVNRTVQGVWAQLVPALAGPISLVSNGPSASGAGAQATWSFTMEGTGTIVGISGVVFRMTGTFETDEAGKPTSFTGELVVDANNDKLPANGSGERNPAVYTVTGSAN